MTALVHVSVETFGILHQVHSALAVGYALVDTGGYQSSCIGSQSVEAVSVPDYDKHVVVEARGRRVHARRQRSEHHSGAVQDVGHFGISVLVSRNKSSVGGAHYDCLTVSERRSKLHILEGLVVYAPGNGELFYGYRGLSFRVNVI